MTSIEPTAGKINDVCVFKDSGLLLLALDCSQIPSYFIPDLGPTPKWCSPIESMTVFLIFRFSFFFSFHWNICFECWYCESISQEELEEGGQTTIYDNYKFLTREDLEKLNLTSLIGTNLLRAYMHGFFVDYRLYKKVMSLYCIVLSFNRVDRPS